MVYQKQLVVVLAPAKLNLSLDVAGLLPNGYHDLDMVMQTIDLYERITLRRSADLTLRLPGSFQCTIQSLCAQMLSEQMIVRQFLIYLCLPALGFG